MSKPKFFGIAGLSSVQIGRTKQACANIIKQAPHLVGIEEPEIKQFSDRMKAVQWAKERNEELKRKQDKLFDKVHQSIVKKEAEQQVDKLIVNDDDINTRATNVTDQLDDHLGQTSTSTNQPFYIVEPKLNQEHYFVNQNDAELFAKKMKPSIRRFNTWKDLSRYFNNQTVEIYTDGSQHHLRPQYKVGAFVALNNSHQTVAEESFVSIPSNKPTNSQSCEIYALQKAINWIKKSKYKAVLIHVDSLPILEALNHTSSALNQDADYQHLVKSINELNCFIAFRKTKSCHSQHPEDAHFVNDYRFNYQCHKLCESVFNLHFPLATTENNWLTGANLPLLHDKDTRQENNIIKFEHPYEKIEQFKIVIPCNTNDDTRWNNYDQAYLGKLDGKNGTYLLTIQHQDHLKLNLYKVHNKSLFN